MRWSKHIEYLINKTSNLVLIFSKIAKFMDYNTLKSIYYALFHSQINYGIIAWGGGVSNPITTITIHSKTNFKDNK